ncbi:MAG TPA: tRNA (N(6)-L-threonylcarbamoyladenosine(37)-C(2))-methylthiotransferase MtaB [Bacilli bacterium]|nr:tRNA (N(6)-L-threonylcarbamoyladenosine(37)-C(2))-methylthiotransferase MtaB [Bacilli bacterium]
MKNKTYVTVSLGCKVNSYEIDSLKTKLEEAGYLPALVSDKVSVALINTCSVTSNADRKSRQQIRRLAKKFPDATLVVMGCYSQINRELAVTIPEIDIMLGTSKRNNIIKHLETFSENKTQIIDIDDDSRTFSYEELKTIGRPEQKRAYLKIQDGCDQFCTFCIIPLTRGKLRSRAESEIINEAKELVESGYKEIVLTGIHTGAYGVDLKTTNLTKLVKEILSAVPKLYKLRISSIEANQVTDELLEIMETDERLARHLHIPLQAGSDEILRRMNRKYTTGEFITMIQKIREKAPNVAITTDVIVGFPGETEALFAETVAFIKAVNFSELHVFPYSMRTRTPAATFKEHVAPQEKKNRVQTLLKLSNELNESYSNKFIGKKVKVLVETYDETLKLYKGHTSNYLEVLIESKEELENEVVTVTFNGYKQVSYLDSVVK